MRRLAVLALLLPGAATAQDACEGAVTQQDLNRCVERSWLAADAELNAIWPKARDVARAIDADLPTAQKGVWQALLDGQRAWITYRDKTCEAEGGPMRGGTAEPLLVFTCRERLTRERIDGLEMFIGGF